MENIIKKQTFLEHKLKQKSKLPDEVISLLKLNPSLDSNGKASNNESEEMIMLYAYSDLCQDFKFQEAWIVVTNLNIFKVEKRQGRYHLAQQMSFSKLFKVREMKSLSASQIYCYEASDMPPKVSWCFTHRQKVIMGHLLYFLEEKSKKNDVSWIDQIDADDVYVDSVISSIVEAQNSINTDNKSALVRLLSYLKPYKKELFWGTTGAVLTTVVSLVPAYVSGYMIDKVIKPFQDGQLSLAESSSIAWVLLSCLALTYVLREAFVWLRLNKMSILGEYVARDLRKELYSHLQTLSMDFYSKKQTGSIISRVSSDTDRIWDFIAFGVVEVGIALITLTGLSAVLISLDWRLGLIMSVPVPFLLFAIYGHGEKMKKLFIKVWRKWSDLTSVLSDTIPGILVVKAFNQEEKEKRRFDNRNDIITAEFNQIHKAWTGFWPLLLMGIHLIVLSVWFFAIPRLLLGEMEPMYLSAGKFISFLLYLTMFAQPIEVIGQVARMLNRALSSAYRIFEILDTNPTITQPENAKEIKKIKGQIEFKNVCFSYDGVRNVIRDMNFKVEPGEMIGLVGTSGGGKSTLTKLLARFYDINKGQVLIDGHDLRDLEIGMLRKQIGMVLQEPFLFHGSIFDNISYGVENVSKKDLIDASKVANAHEFINKLPFGYDTIVGERGHTLSGGERQRISIARAILANPRILILDEATSAVDTETERKIQQALDRLVKGRTVFAVAHRLSTLRQANRIFVIKDGVMVESGSHAELLDKEAGEYRKLHEMQQEMNKNFAL